MSDPASGIRWDGRVGGSSIGWVVGNSKFKIENSRATCKIPESGPLSALSKMQNFDNAF
jgi:hypothetical protein